MVKLSAIARNLTTIGQNADGYLLELQQLLGWLRGLLQSIPQNGTVISPPILTTYQAGVPIQIVLQLTDQADVQNFSTAYISFASLFQAQKWVNYQFVSNDLQA